MTSTNAPWLQPHEDWNLHIGDCVLPDLADCQGRSLASLRLRSNLGCTVVGIERQGLMIPLPGPETVLYARDKVLLLGTVEQVKAGKQFLHTVTVSPASHTVFDEVSMEVVSIPVWSPLAGCALGAIAPAHRHGVLFAGLNRHGRRVLNPSATEELRAGDEVLALGTPQQIRDFKAWLQEKPAESGEARP